MTTSASPQTTMIDARRVYEFFLGRDPENDDVCRAMDAQPPAAILYGVLGSEEFRSHAVAVVRSGGRLSNAKFGQKLDPNLIGWSVTFVGGAVGGYVPAAARMRWQDAYLCAFANSGARMLLQTAVGADAAADFMRHLSARGEDDPVFVGDARGL